MSKETELFEDEEQQSRVEEEPEVKEIPEEEPGEEPKSNGAPISMVTDVHQIRTAGKLKNFDMASRKLTVESYLKTEDVETLDKMVKNGWIVNIKLDYTERQTSFLPPENEVEDEPESEEKLETEAEAEKGEGNDGTGTTNESASSD